MKCIAFISKNIDTHSTTDKAFIMRRVAITHETLLDNTNIIAAHLDLLENKIVFKAYVS